MPDFYSLKQSLILYHFLKLSERQRVKPFVKLFGLVKVISHSIEIFHDSDLLPALKGEGSPRSQGLHPLCECYSAVLYDEGQGFFIAETTIFFAFLRMFKITI